jgi:hypothetical protein
MAKTKKKNSKKKPKIIAKFFKLARSRADSRGVGIDAICEHFKCSTATIYNYEDERRVLTYNQLRRYVEFYGLPAGVMLIITRITAELRDGHADRAEKLAKGIQALAAHLIDKKAELADRDYQNANEKEVERTLGELWDVYATHGLCEQVPLEKLRQ